AGRRQVRPPMVVVVVVMVLMAVPVIVPVVVPMIVKLVVTVVMVMTGRGAEAGGGERGADRDDQQPRDHADPGKERPGHDPRRRGQGAESEQVDAERMRGGDDDPEQQRVACGPA